MAISNLTNRVGYRILHLRQLSLVHVAVSPSVLFPVTSAIPFHASHMAHLMNAGFATSVLATVSRLCVLRRL